MKAMVIVVLGCLAGCSGVSSSFQHPPQGDVQVSQVIQQQDSYLGEPVRWGGKVISVSNQQNSSTIEVVQFPLNRYGRPLATQPSQGRFLVRSAQFLDPEVYKIGVMVTFLGNVTTTDSMTVDQRALVVPVMSIEDSYTWVDKYTGEDKPYNPRRDAPFVGIGYYATGGYTP